MRQNKLIALIFLVVAVSSLSAAQPATITATISSNNAGINGTTVQLAWNAANMQYESGRFSIAKCSPTNPLTWQINIGQNPTKDWYFSGGAMLDANGKLVQTWGTAFRFEVATGGAWSGVTKGTPQINPLTGAVVVPAQDIPFPDCVGGGRIVISAQ